MTCVTKIEATIFSSNLFYGKGEGEIEIQVAIYWTEKYRSMFLVSLGESWDGERVEPR